MKSIHIYIGLVLLLFGCKKEVGPQSINLDEKGIGKLIVINEGNFGFGNASVSLYDPNTGEIANNQYKKVNGIGIGDVLQSVKRHGNKFYFVVNNSGKVVVTDTNLNLITEITGFNSPRYMEFFVDKAFVTDLKQKAVYVVDLVSNQIINQIPTQGWTEHIIMHNNKLYVMDRGDYLTNSTQNFLYIINPTTLIKEDSIQVGINPNSMVLDINLKLWILTSGYSGIENGRFQRIDLDSNKIDFTYIFNSSTDKPSRLTYDYDIEKFYFLNSSIYTVNNDVSGFIPSVFYQKNNENFYGLNVIKGIIYATNAKNYNQIGNINMFNSLGEELNITTSSIIPQSVN